MNRVVSINRCGICPNHQDVQFNEIRNGDIIRYEHNPHIKCNITNLVVNPDLIDENCPLPFEGESNKEFEAKISKLKSELRRLKLENSYKTTKR